jgi:hypothetical protein
MHSSRSDTTGKSTGQFQTNVYTKKRLKLTIMLESAAASHFEAARTCHGLTDTSLDANRSEAVAELVLRAVSQYHSPQT